MQNLRKKENNEYYRNKKTYLFDRGRPREGEAEQDDEEDQLQIAHDSREITLNAGEEKEKTPLAGDRSSFLVGGEDKEKSRRRSLERRRTARW